MILTMTPDTSTFTLGNGQPKAAGTWDWYGAYDPAHHQPAASARFSVGVFQWLPKKGQGVKRGKSVARFSGAHGQPQLVYAQALAFIAQQNAGQSIPITPVNGPAPLSKLPTVTTRPGARVMDMPVAKVFPTAPIRRIVRRPGHEKVALPHAAIIWVVGWALERGSGAYFIGNLRVDVLPPEWLGRRVRATLYPAVCRPAHDVLYLCQVARICEANSTEPDAAEFEIVGHLMGVKPSNHRIRVKVVPQTQGISSFCMEVYTTQDAMQACAPSWIGTGVKITGSMLSPLLLVEEIAQVHAPIAPHWDNWGWRRQQRQIPTQNHSAAARREAQKGEEARPA